MNESITIRDAQSSEFDGIFALHKKLFRSEIDERWGWDEQNQLDNFTNEWQSHQFISVLVADDLIGYVQSSEEADHIYLHSIGFIEAFRRKGLAKKILKKVLINAQNIGKDVRLSVSPKNNIALKLYSTLGFEIDSVDGTSVRYIKKHLRTE